MSSHHYQPRRWCVVFVFCVVVIGVVAVPLVFSESQAKLSPRYREWLDRDVAYIISKQEKNVFLQLATDEARDQFIERFWEIRNPAPGAPDNAYRIEHYRRLEYANDYFGHASHTDGWRTDMGRVYITLGEPQQRQKLLGLQKITPMEIWFYQNGNAALPPFFYVIFYQREISDDFRLYSPSSDGPEKLITAQVGPTRAEALKILSDDAGRDVARETLSLIPEEPVDMQAGTASLASDVMLGTIKNLANNPISQAELANRRRNLEDVSHRIVLGNEYLDVVAVPLRDAAGNTNLHFVLRLKKPEDFTVGQSATGNYYYAILVSVKVTSSDGKVIWSDEKKISRNLTAEQLEQVKGKVFGYESWLPLPPNKYKLEFQLTNLLGNTAFRREMEAEVPEIKPTLQASNLVPFAEASMVPPDASKSLPFSGAGVKFIPMAGRELEVTQGRSLNFFYQVWDPPALGTSRTGKKLEVDYVYGRMGARDTQTIHDEISLDQLDAAGSVLNGKRILTGELTPGNYRLVMTLRDPETQAKVFGSLAFSVYTTSSSAPAWDVSDDSVAASIGNGIADFQRAQCYLAFGDKVQAVEWLERAHAKNPSDERFRNKLVELYFGRQEYAKVAGLYASSGITQSTDEQSILRIAESFDRSGDAKKAVAVMEAGTNLNPSSGPLLLGLAEYYRKTGEERKAAAAEQKGKHFMASHPES
jgi:GWxTD domain-containing protein